jgi:GNAT superfamily N-acetyltransferase
VDVRVVTAVDTAGLRQRVLRPFLTVEEVIAQGDGSPGIAVYEDGRVVACANVIEEPMPDDEKPGDWRLRGMASDPELRGQGYGAAALNAALTYARERGGARVWANCRSGAKGFYEHHGFTAVGEEFHLEPIGPHWLMFRSLS